MKNLKGWRTVGINLLFIIAPPAIAYLANVDWNALLGTTSAFIVSGVVNMALRVITDTPIGKSV